MANLNPDDRPPRCVQVRTLTLNGVHMYSFLVGSRKCSSSELCQTQHQCEGYIWATDMQTHSDHQSNCVMSLE